MRERITRGKWPWLAWALLGLSLSFSSCSERATPTATPLLTPDARTLYVMMTDRYTSVERIFGAHVMSSTEAARILRALQAIEPPQHLESLHERAVDGYRHIVEGKLLLPEADNVVRAEALFMVDWGISLLLDYRERLDGEIR